MSSATTFGFEELVKLHRGFIARGEGKRLGRMIKIVLGEVPRDVPLSLSKAEITREGRTLDWFDQGPLLGLSPGDVDLLVTSPLPPLPAKPDAAFVSAEVTQAEITRAVERHGKWNPPRAPLVAQKPEDRGARRIRGTNMLVFEPVYQVLFRPIGVQVFGCVQGMSAAGTEFSFCWDFDTGNGYFYGGRFIVKI